MQQRLVKVQKLFRKIQESGLIISTGTERSLFDLILCAEANGESCEGLVVRDINPKVKAYIDFVVMLLRISKTREEFCSYIQDIYTRKGQLPEEKGLERIRVALADASLPEQAKKYYATHLEDLAEIYCRTTQDWRSIRVDDFRCVQYYEKDDLFKIVQRYAKAGQIIATVGDIQDLTFLGERKVQAIDVSNIPDYIMIDIAKEAWIIWTSPSTQTKYYSCRNHPIKDPNEKAELHQLAKEFYRAQVATSAIALRTFMQEVDETEHTQHVSSYPPSYSEGIFSLLKGWKEKWMRNIPDFEIASLHPTMGQKIILN